MTFPNATPVVHKVEVAVVVAVVVVVVASAES